MPKVHAGDLVTVKLKVVDVDEQRTEGFYVARLIVPNVPGSQTILVMVDDILSVEERPWQVGEFAYISNEGVAALVEVVGLHNGSAWIRNVATEQYATTPTIRLVRQDRETSINPLVNAT